MTATAATRGKLRVKLEGLPCPNCKTPRMIAGSRFSFQRAVICLECGSRYKAPEGYK